MQDLGNTNLTMKAIRSKMTCYDLATVPSESTISRILHQGLGYVKRNFCPAVVKYNCSDFDEKRKRICREIGLSLAFGDDVVLCIDESSFSTHNYSKKKWQESHAFKKRQQDLEYQREVERVRQLVKQEATEPLGPSPNKNVSFEPGAKLQNMMSPASQQQPSSLGDRSSVRITRKMHAMTLR